MVDDRRPPQPRTDGGVSDVGDLTPKMISALDQFSGVCSQVADMTIAHHKRLTDAHVPAKLADTLTGDLHDALLELFVLPKPDKEPDE